MTFRAVRGFRGLKRMIFACTVAMLMATAPIAAQHGSGGSKKPPTTHAPKAPKTTTHATAPTPHGGSPKSGVTHGGGHGSTKTMTAKSMKPAKPAKTVKVSTTTKSAKATKPAKTSKTTATTTTTTTTTTTGTTPTTTTLSPVQQKLERNTKLASKLQSRLPAGTDVTAAAAGFRNLGQFVAAVNVSNNLGIPFAELKTRMVDQHMSLGQAIQDARPATTDTTVVAQRAQTDADAMIRTTTSESTVVSSTTVKAKTKAQKAKKRNGDSR